MKKIILFLFLFGCTGGPVIQPLPPPLEIRDSKLAWDQPTTDPNDGYRIHYGIASRDYPTAIDVKKVYTAEMKDLPKAKIYFAATAYIGGDESQFSNEVSIDYTKDPPVVNNAEVTDDPEVPGEESPPPPMRPFPPKM